MLKLDGLVGLLKYVAYTVFVSSILTACGGGGSDSAKGAANELGKVTLGDLSTRLQISTANISDQGFVVVVDADDSILGEAFISGKNSDVMLNLNRPITSGESIRLYLYHDSDNDDELSDADQTAVDVNGMDISVKLDEVVLDTDLAAVRLTLSNNGNSSWNMQAEPASYTEWGGVANGDNPYLLLFEYDVRIEVVNPSAATHPFSLFNTSQNVVLLSYDGEALSGSFVDDSDVKAAKLDESTMRFTLHEPLFDNVDMYRCETHFTSMFGVVLKSSEGNEGGIGVVEPDYIRDFEFVDLKTRLYVAEVRISGAGFVVASDELDDIIGYQFVSDVQSDIWLGLNRPLSDGEAITMSLYNDTNNNGEFDIAEDLPTVLSSGAQVAFTKTIYIDPQAADVRLELANSGNEGWLIQATPASFTGWGEVAGEINPVLTIAALGYRYEIVNKAFLDHPFSLINANNANEILLSLGANGPGGSFFDDREAFIDMLSPNTLRFTLTAPLYDSISHYRCEAHPQAMIGQVVMP